MAKLVRGSAKLTFYVMNIGFKVLNEIFTFKYKNNLLTLIIKREHVYILHILIFVKFFDLSHFLFEYRLIPFDLHYSFDSAHVKVFAVSSDSVSEILCFSQKILNGF